MNQAPPTETLKGIAPFVRAADLGSFAAAAAQLHLSSSAVSKSVARLEARLGVRLFDRTTRALALTDAGRAFYDTCVRILKELSEAEAVLAAQKAEPAGRVRVDLPATFGRLVVLPIVLDLARRYPYLRPQVSFTDRFVDIAEDGVDIAVRIGHWHPSSASIAHRRLGRERLIFCAAPGYLAQAGTPRRPADLDRHDCIGYGRADGSVIPWTFPAGEGVVEPRVMSHRMIFGDAEAQRAAVVAGGGIAQMATWLVADALAAGTLVQVLVDQVAEGLPLFLVWNRARQLMPKTDVVLRELEAQLACCMDV